MSGGWQSATPPVVTLLVRCGTLAVATPPVGCGTLHDRGHPTRGQPAGRVRHPARVQPACGHPARRVRLCPGPTCTWQPARGVRQSGGVVSRFLVVLSECVPRFVV